MAVECRQTRRAAAIVYGAQLKPPQHALAVEPLPPVGNRFDTAFRLLTSHRT